MELAFALGDVVLGYVCGLDACADDAEHLEDFPAISGGSLGIAGIVDGYFALAVVHGLEDSEEGWGETFD